VTLSYLFESITFGSKVYKVGQIKDACCGMWMAIEFVENFRNEGVK
jgi:hypothetical protein